MNDDAINIRRKGDGLFRVYVGNVAFEVTTHRRDDNGIFVRKSTEVFVQPTVWHEITDRVKAMVRHEREPEAVQ